MTFNVANALTFLRLLASPVFVLFFLSELRMWAFVIYVAAGFTDLIDGTVARLLKQDSKGGALMDPIADKLLMQSCFILLVITGYLPMWFFVIAFIRDVMIISGIFYLEWKKIQPQYRAIWLSKLATLFQMVVAGFGLLRWWREAAAGPMPGVLLWQEISIAVAAVLIIVSGAQYVQMGFRLLAMKGTDLKGCPR
jgi:cardiolipin synthase